MMITGATWSTPTLFVLSSGHEADTPGKSKEAACDEEFQLTLPKDDQGNKPCDPEASLGGPS